ncbi:hypothetical protein Pmani_000213 [Petrolisthes manimaculis]|uniref:Clathrin/coatomer adaptor adaptin-like N-terminal domain-containing protein n=1 Tax=Petrolisthes manimaculis TaxID=1843537 RepID=A0AAE1QN93_9EUCA|nr:hypothetical protein Pmani_000213 [Petrolisthes manimaculis]
MLASSPDSKLLLSKVVSSSGGDGVALTTSDVVELLASHHTLAKKLTCTHIAHSCKSNGDLALLTANLLLRDASDANPSVRSASVCALAALPGIEDSAVPALLAALSDHAPLVRRAGVVGCHELYTHAPGQVVVGGGLVDALYEAVRDPDPIVVTNALLALDDLLQDEGGVVINRNIAHHLLARIMNFSEHSAVFVLTVLARYFPKSEEELYLLLNTMDELLSSKAPAVLVSTVRLFVHWTAEHPHHKKDMMVIIRPSICKILAQNVAETSYLLLEFLSELGEIREVFGPYYKYFLVRSKDPGYIKAQKLMLLPSVSTEDNVCSLVNEVRPFCSDYQSFHDAVVCLGAMAKQSTPARNLCLTTLVSLLDTPAEKVVIAVLESLLCVLPQVPSQSQQSSHLQVASSHPPPVASSHPPQVVASHPPQVASSHPPQIAGSHPPQVVGSQLQIEGVPQVAGSQTQVVSLLHKCTPPSEAEIDNKNISSTENEFPPLPPQLVQDLQEVLTRALWREGVQAAAPTLVLQVVGCLAPLLPAAPDIIQRMSPLCSTNDHTHADLITAAARVFFARPTQMQLLLASILAQAFNTPGVPAKRAALVYSILQEEPNDAAQLLGASVVPLSLSSEMQQTKIVSEEE